MTTRLKSLGLMAVAAFGVVFCTLASAQAQIPVSKLTAHGISNPSEFRLNFFGLPPRKRSFSLRPAGFALMPATNATNTSGMTLAAGPNLQVFGSGTIGRLTKWTGFTSSSSVIGDSTIFEDKFGNVGIGTDSPTSRLTVGGMIQTTTGGVKFPDGTVQTTAALGGLQFVFTDSTLRGNGTSGFPLGVHIPVTLSGSAQGEILAVLNSGDGGSGITGHGGDSLLRGGNGVQGFGGAASGSDSGGIGVLGRGGDSATGIAGTAVGGLGGTSNSGAGGPGAILFGGSGNGTGNRGGIGILAQPGPGFNGATPGLAGLFLGDVQVTGNLSKGGGSFKIDHPLDPENKYLYHSFVESPDMMNIYNGNAFTDASGEAIVELPAYFQSLNRDFRYQLTVIGTFAQAIVAEEINENRFTIRTSSANVKVSWQVTGIRNDAYANKHRIPVEEVKPEQERGLYLHPEAFNKPEQRGVAGVHTSGIMQIKKSLPMARE